MNKNLPEFRDFKESERARKKHDNKVFVFVIIFIVLIFIFFSVTAIHVINKL